MAHWTPEAQPIDAQEPRKVACSFCGKVGIVPNDVSDADYQEMLYHPVCPICAAKPLYELIEAVRAE